MLDIFTFHLLLNYPSTNINLYTQIIQNYTVEKSKNTKLNIILGYVTDDSRLEAKDTGLVTPCKPCTVTKTYLALETIYQSITRPNKLALYLAQSKHFKIHQIESKNMQNFNCRTVYCYFKHCSSQQGKAMCCFLLEMSVWGSKPPTHYILKIYCTGLGLENMIGFTINKLKLDKGRIE